MKRIFLLTMLCCFYLTAHCQNYKHDIGLNLFKYSVGYSAYNLQNIKAQIGFKEYELIETIEYEKYSTLILPQVFFSTRIYRNLRYRASLQFKRTISEWKTYSVNPINYTLHHTGYNNQKDHRLYVENGIQYSVLRDRKVQPYGFGLGTVLLISENLDQFDKYRQPLDGGKSDSQIAIGLAIGVGVKYQFLKKFSSSLESQLSQGPNNYSPISRFSINYHF